MVYWWPAAFRSSGRIDGRYPEQLQMHTLLGFSRNKYKRATDRYTVDVHVRATCSTPKCHGASGFALLENRPSILTFARCYGAVKHLFVRCFLVPGGAGRHARYRGKHTSQEAAVEQSTDDMRVEEKGDGGGDE